MYYLNTDKGKLEAVINNVALKANKAYYVPLLRKVAATRNLKIG